MGKILITITGQNGILNASLELARRLALAGHEVQLAAPRPVGERIEREGWAFTELPEILMEPAKLPALGSGPFGKLAGLYARWSMEDRLRAEANQATRPLAFVELTRQSSPDLLLIDIELHEYILAAHGRGLNYILLSQWYSLWRRPGLPYQLTHAIPGVGEDGTPAAIAAHWDKITKQRRGMFKRIARLSFGADRRSTLLRLAGENDFPLDTLEENYWPGAFTYDRLPVIAMAPLEMEFPHEPRPNLHYVGPMVHATRREKDAVSYCGKPIGDILDSAEAAGKKVILVTVSTLHAGDSEFLRRVVAATATVTDWEVIIGLGGKLKPEELTGTSAGARSEGNVHFFSYVPQLRVLARADLSVNHGGIHTIHECLHFGVPMLVYSGKRSDQPGCAARVHYHRVGVMADKDIDQPDAIREKISQVLSGPYRANVGHMRDRMFRYAEERTVEGLVAQSLTGQKLSS